MKACLEIPICDLYPLSESPNSQNIKLSPPHAPPGWLYAAQVDLESVPPSYSKWVRRNKSFGFRIHICHHWSVHEMDGRRP